jgi:hypothetical protein
MALPYSPCSYSHQKYPGISAVVELRKYSLTLGCIQITIYSAEANTFFMKEFAHKIQTPPPEREDYTGGMISKLQTTAVSSTYLLS